MTVREAQEIEVGEMVTLLGGFLVTPYAEGECHVCHRSEELRCGACFTCQDQCLTDRKHVWTRDDPKRRWKYIWNTEYDRIRHNPAKLAAARVFFKMAEARQKAEKN